MPTNSQTLPHPIALMQQVKKSFGFGEFQETRKAIYETFGIQAKERREPTLSMIEGPMVSHGKVRFTEGEMGIKVAGLQDSTNTDSLCSFKQLYERQRLPKLLEKPFIYSVTGW